MKKTLKLGFVAILAVIAVAFGALTASLFNTKKAYAADNNFNMVAGASVRLSDENRGIRFTAEFSKDFLDEEAAYRMMIIPADWLTKYSLTAGADYYKTLVEDNNLTNVAVMNCTPFVYGENYRIQGSLTDIQEKNLNRKWFGIAYREKDNARVYADFNDGENQRSICEVAGAALNDLTENYSEDSKTYLTNQVLNTYKKVSGNSEATMDNVKSLYTITTDNTNFLITKGDSKELSYTLTATDNTIADKLGLKLGYYSDNGELMTVADDGTVTASSENSGMVTVGAVLLGEKVTDKAVKAMVRSEMAGNMLEDYADECSKSQFARDMQKDVNGNVATEWLSDFNGRNGVVKLKSGVNTILSSGSVDGNAGCVRFFYNRSYEQMINLDFDYISIWAYFEKGDSASEAETVDIKNGSLVLGSALEFGKWTELKIAKSDITNIFAKSWETFCARHDQAVMHGNIANNGTMIFSTGIEGINVYFDSVAFIKISVPDYTVPTSGEFALPDVKMLDINGNDLGADRSEDITIEYKNKASATLTTKANVENGKIKITSGSYTIKYIFEYGGFKYEKTLDKFSGTTAELGANMLEDFNDPSRACYNSEVWNNNSTANSSWYDYFNGRYGVASNTNDKATGIAIRFAKTQEEILALDFDFITVGIYFDYDGKLNIKASSGESYTVDGKQWVDIKITKEQIINNTENYYNTNAANITAGSGMSAFAYRHHSKTSGNWLIETGIKGVTYYLDYVSFGKNA